MTMGGCASKLVFRGVSDMTTVCPRMRARAAGSVGFVTPRCRRAAGMRTVPTVTDVKPARERWIAQWAELYDEVVTTGLCTGCAGCVVVCPHDVLGYDHKTGGYRPFQLEDELGPSDGTHRVKGC